MSLRFLTRSSRPRARRSPPGVRLGLRLIVALLSLAGAAGLAAAVDMDKVAAVGSRQELNRRIQQARDKVDQARIAAEETRHRLDAFLSRHFAEQKAAEPPRFAPERATGPPVALPNPEIVKLEEELAVLRVHRMRLLSYLTEAHPELIELDVRMATISDRIDGLKVPELPPPSNDDDVERQWAEFVQQHKQQSAHDAQEYQRLFDEWTQAEDALTAAIDEWKAAQEDLELLPDLLDDEQVAVQAQPVPEMAAAPAAPDVEKRATDDNEAKHAAQPAAAEASGSAPLALAALLIALAVAALAAVRLARSAVDPVFASVDEVAAALALPVVGLLPAGGSLPRSARQSVTKTKLRHWIVPVLVAVVVLVLGTLAVKNAEGLRNLVHESISGMR